MTNMPKQMEIEFERGGRLVATLLEDEAPKTCQAIWNRLPITADVSHSMYSGKTMGVVPSPSVEFNEIENPRMIGLLPGDITYFNGVQLPTHARDIQFIYGHGVILRGSLSFGWLVNLFARMRQEDLGELEKIGKRVHDKGKEKVTIRRKE